MKRPVVAHQRALVTAHQRALVTAHRRALVCDDLTPVAAYAALRNASKRSNVRSDAGPSFLLESAIGGEEWGRYSVLGWRPRRSVTLDLAAGGREVRLDVTDLRTGATILTKTAPARDAIALLRAHAVSSASASAGSSGSAGTSESQVTGARLDFASGAVGWFAYDLVHALEPIPAWPGTRRLAALLDGATFVVFDALLQTVTLHGEDEAEIDATLDALERDRTRLRPFEPPRRDVALPSFETSLDDAAYASIVDRAKEYIRAGDVFQVVLARKLVVERAGVDPFEVYRALRVLNPSPYLYCLELGGGGLGPSAIVGASPETLVRVEGRRVVVRPIAGTRPRGADPERDQALERELVSDPKELAEHVMLVDLGRNDVGRVSAIGSVVVPQKMIVERYSHVMHLVSEVHGRLADDRDAWDALAATFPAGTLSGAPKVRAMQIIRELEPEPRGVYGGAIGYVSRDGTMDFAIAIRTLVAHDDRFEIGAGAGIVEGSDPRAEAAETRHKATAALAALAAARSGLPTKQA